MYDFERREEGIKFTMKNSSIVSAIVGGAFFAIPFLGMSAPIIPSLAIGVAAFGASELVLKDNNTKNIQVTDPNLYNTLKNAKEMNKKIREMSGKIKDSQIQKSIIEISDTTDKIISTIENEPSKKSKVNNFFNYYLPVTLNILQKYDQIEDQSLTSEDSKKFMNDAKEMMEKIDDAFKKQLSNLYNDEIVDTGAEMKVFESMLKTDGFDSDNNFENIAKRSKDDINNNK